jgi:hypothetical protein
MRSTRQPFDVRLALKHQSEVGEEPGRRREVSG